MEIRPLRTLALCCPDWPITAAGAAPHAPVAILEGEGRHQIVTACSPTARQSGVRRGQRVREAQRHCPQLVVYRRDEAREAREFEPVIAAAERLAASVEVVRPGLITVDVRSSARYHGGEARLAALLRDAVAQLATTSGNPIGCGIGIADGAFAATLAAHKAAPRKTIPPDPATSNTAPSNRWSSNAAPSNTVIVEPGSTIDFLAPFPVTALERPGLAKSLRRLGARTLGSFAALPGAEVAGRFGIEGLLAQRLARGLDARQPATRRSIAALSVVHEFDPPAERDELVALVGTALANRLHLTLAVSSVACVRLGIEVVTASGRACYRMWRHDDALGERLPAPAIAERIRWQLDGWRAREPYPTADPVVALRLVPERLVVDNVSQQQQTSPTSQDARNSPDTPDTRDSHGGAGMPNRVERAVERVEALLGPGAVQRPATPGKHDPTSPNVPPQSLATIADSSPVPSWSGV